MNKKCLDCAEKVKIEAKMCRHCGYRFTDEELAKSERENGCATGVALAIMLPLMLAFCSPPGCERGNQAVPAPATENMLR